MPQSDSSPFDTEKKMSPLHPQPLSRKAPPRIRTRLARTLGSLLALMLALASAAPAQADKKPSPAIQKEAKRCYNQYRRKYFLQAATCYLALRKKHKSPQYLTQIAQSYRLAALNQLSPALAALLREKAIQTLQQYKKEAPQNNFWSDSMIKKLNAKIGYAQIALSSTPVNADFTLEGQEYKNFGKLPFKARLRPGKYTIKLTAKGHKSKQHAFEVKPKADKKLQLVLTPTAAPAGASAVAPAARRPAALAGATALPTAPGSSRRPAPPARRKVAVRTQTPPGRRPPAITPRSKPRLLPWIGVATAGALVATGVVFVGLSASNQGQANDPNTSAQAAIDAIYQSNWQMPTGWTFVGVGAAVGIGAAVLFFVPQNNTTASASIPSQRAFVFSAR